MIIIEKTLVMNFEAAMRGARNPMKSWDRGDSFTAADGSFVLGPNDLGLARRLCAAGGDHRKFIRQIFVSCDVTAPLYWWKEYDTYKVGTVANSTSTMHKIQSKAFGRDDFSHDKMSPEALTMLDITIAFLERTRKRFIDGNDKAYWFDLIQLLPSSYNQTRTCTLNYENLVNIYHSRRNHKLEEWHAYCDWILTLPYAPDLIVTATTGGAGSANEA